MKKFMIRCDMEGVSGVVDYEQSTPGSSEFHVGQAMLMSDLSALATGLNESGADEIWIYDEHYCGRNVDLGALPENCFVICGKPPYRKDWAGGLDATFNGLILLGFHSKNSTGELLHHSYEPDIKGLILNGASIGEIGVETAIAGDYDVPLIMITADSAGVEEARAIAPEVASVNVKTSLGESGGVCPASRHTARLIRQTAAKVADTPPSVVPWRVSQPELVVQFNPGPYHETFRSLFSCGDEIVIRGATVTECWADYWRMKLETQRTMT